MWNVWCKHCCALNNDCCVWRASCRTLRCVLSGWQLVAGGCWEFCWCKNLLMIVSVTSRLKWTVTVYIEYADPGHSLLQCVTSQWMVSSLQTSCRQIFHTNYNRALQPASRQSKYKFLVQHHILFASKFSPATSSNHLPTCCWLYRFPRWPVVSRTTRAWGFSNRNSLGTTRFSPLMAGGCQIVADWSLGLCDC